MPMPGNCLPVERRTDPLGNPLPKRGQAPRHRVNPVYPTGIYVLTYEGQGQVQVTPESAVKKAMPGRIEIEKDKALGQITVVVSDIDPQDPPRSFQLWMPGLENSKSRFHPDFIERLRPYGVIRGHQWQPCWNPQANTLVAWNQRTLPEHNSYARAGVPYEVFIDLCNELHASPWFSIPLRVDDDFVRQFSKLIQQHVGPDLPIYVEYVNEPWNPANESKSWDYLLEKSRALNLGGSGREAVSRYYALRSQQVLDILAEVFGDEKHRLVRVLQLANDLGTALEYRETYKHVDAIAINTYFGHPPGKLITKPWGKVTDDDVFTALDRNLNTIIKPRVVRAASSPRNITSGWWPTKAATTFPITAVASSPRSCPPSGKCRNASSPAPAWRNSSPVCWTCGFKTGASCSCIGTSAPTPGASRPRWPTTRPNTRPPSQSSTTLNGELPPKTSVSPESAKKHYERTHRPAAPGAGSASCTGGHIGESVTSDVKRAGFSAGTSQRYSHIAGPMACGWSQPLFRPAK